MKINLRITIFSILIFSCFVSHSQSNKTLLKMEYEYQNGFVSKIETLITDGDRSLYIKPSNKLKKEKDLIINDDSNWIIPVTEINTSSITIFSNKNEKNIYEYTVDMNNNRYMVNDSTFHIDWKIIKNKTKTIGTYTCYKAIADFRGRNYIAYFTPDVQVNFGPFKFHNLPGLILQISNQETDITHSWNLKNITEVEKGFKMPSIKEFDAPRINRRQLREINLELIEAKSRRFSSRKPSGVTHVKSSIKNLGIEQSFEWETEDK